MVVPIIGHPTITNWFVTVQVICPCQHPVLLVGQVGARSACQKCGKVYQLNGLPSMGPEGFSVPLGVSTPQQQ